MTISVATNEAKKSFYPTPPDLARELLDGIEWTTVSDVLEPSAGKGNLVDAIAGPYSLAMGSWYRERTLNVDCVEIDPYLRSILAYEYGEEKEDAISARKDELMKKARYNHFTREYEDLTPEEKAELNAITLALRKMRAVDLHVVHDDFMTFDSRKRYDLIIVNPPFAEGDSHLLKAISLLEPYGGQIRCLLNAETIRNPYTKRRQVLMQKLEEIGAEIEFKESVFEDAERPTLVEVAMIKATVPAPKYEEDPESLYNRMKAATGQADEDSEVTDLTPVDFLERIVAQFNFEVDVGLRLIREYRAMEPRILSSLDKNEAEPILTIRVGKSDGCNTNEFLRKVRRKYWTALLSNKQFIGKLTSNLQNKYRGMVDDLVNYDFTMFNIQKIMTEMNAEMAKGVRDTIVDLFDQMTAEHSWYPEMKKNIHYFNGWATNKVHKVGQKVILPANGLFSDYSWCKPFLLRRAEEILSDIEKVFNYLDGNMTVEVSLQRVLSAAHAGDQTKNIDCKFFSVTFYKKGTMHLRFHSQDLVDRFNIYCCQQKGWLPPDYGKKRYADMSSEEKVVVDSFHGDETAGSGEAAYEKMLARANYFLAPPNQEPVGLPQATA